MTWQPEAGWQIFEPALPNGAQNELQQPVQPLQARPSITQLVGAAFLPGLDLHDGIPAELRTIVVVPTLLTALSEVDTQVERLEVHYLSNPDEHLAFALLSDWGDSPGEHAAGGNRFMAHRGRVYEPSPANRSGSDER